MKNFLKGIVVGLGAIAPGLSGSVLMVIFGLYEKVVNAIGNIFKDLKKNIIFLVPLVLGMGLGVVLFSKVIDYFLVNFEMQTRFAFLGLVLGTIPLFNKEVKKNGFLKRYYIVIAVSIAVGLFVFSFNRSSFPQIEDPTLIQSVLLGVAVACSYIIPGVDSAVILSTLGLYELYVSSLANFDLQILIPAGVGLGLGVLAASFIMSRLLKKLYTLTFSVIFGLFISIIPNVLNESCVLAPNGKTAASLALAVAGFLLSFYLGDIQGNNEKLKFFLRKLKTQK